MKAQPTLITGAIFDVHYLLKYSDGIKEDGTIFVVAADAERAIARVKAHFVNMTMLDDTYVKTITVKSAAATSETREILF